LKPELIPASESNLGDDDSSDFMPSRKAELWRNNSRACAFAVCRSDISESLFSEDLPLSIETPLQPNMAERAIDTATDVSRTIADLSAALQSAVDRLSKTIATARQPGKPLSTISAITREAPLASLFVAFLFGVAVARRR
jgi:hypothetical protein